MGRKIDMKKIEDVTKCQVTFSKRRTSLMKKANELSICCDVDIAFVAFSPSGRVSKFCNQKRIEDVLQRYVNLQADKRLTHMNNVLGKMEKIKQLSHIHGESSKLHYLDKQMENLELQIKKTGLELQILETDLRDYETTGGELDPSLHQLSWCERNLKHSLRRVIARKLELVELESQNQKQFPNSFHQNEAAPSNPLGGQILMQLDPWISPYSAKVRESIFQDLVGQAKQPSNDNKWVNNSVQIPSNYPIQESSSQQKQPLMMEKPMFNFHGPSNVHALKHSMMMDQFHNKNNTGGGAYNGASVVFSDAIHISTANLFNNQDPRSSGITNTNITNPSTVGMGRSVFVPGIGSGLQSLKPNSMSQVSNMEGSQQIGQVNMQENTLSYNANVTTPPTAAVVVAAAAANDVYVVAPPDFSTINDQNPRNGQPHGAQDAGHGNNLVFEENNEVNNAPWASNLQQKTWEWEDMFLDENFNFQNMP